VKEKSPRGARLAGKRPESSINVRQSRASSERKYLMSKKLIMACMAVAAFAAFVAPATALATNDPDLTCDQGGSLCAVGTKIVGTNVGVLLMTDANTNVLTECSSATMTGTVTKNDGSNVEGTIETATFSGTGTNGECTSSFGGITVETNIGNGVPWCLRSTSTMTTNEFQVRGNSCSLASRSITFVLNSTTIGKCRYNRPTPAPGTYTTEATGDAILNIAGQEWAKEEGSVLCPTKGFLDLNFTLETENGSTLGIS
jgi:hypothetical protein